MVEGRAELDHYRAAVPGAQPIVCRLTAPLALMHERLKRSVTGEGPGKPIWLKLGRDGNRVVGKSAVPGAELPRLSGLDVPHDAEAVVELLEGTVLSKRTRKHLRSPRK